MSSIASASEEASATTEEFSSSIEEINASVEESTSGAHELACVVKQLNELIRHYNVEFPEEMTSSADLIPVSPRSERVAELSLGLSSQRGTR
jgi:methyl-accepting chemotaxis protein